MPDAPATVLFDLDGTILDSSRPVLSSWGIALSAMGLPVLERSDLGQVIGPPTSMSAPGVLRDRGVDDPAAVVEVLERFELSMRAIEVEQALAYPGIIELIERLHESGRRLAIVTSKPLQAAELVVPALGIGHRFVHIEAPDRERPEPKEITMGRAVVALRLDPADTVLIGDRHHDVDAGRAHGISTIGVTWGGFTSRDELETAGAIHVIDHVDELLPLLG